MLFLARSTEGLTHIPFVALLSALSILAAIEKLAAVLNTISVERDWVVVIAGSDESRLMALNARMRQIDLFCKLVGPLLISFVDAASPKLAILVTGGMTLLSLPIEYWAIARVYAAVPALSTTKIASTTETSTSSTATLPRIWQSAKATLSSTSIYIHHPAFLPSLSLALLYLTVLSFSGQLIAYLLALGTPASVIGLLRGVSTIFELSATWLGPKVMERIGPIRAGIWFLNWQIACVGVACALFWLNCSTLVTAAGVVSAVIASRVGLWGFDLSAQIIVQEA